MGEWVNAAGVTGRDSERDFEVEVTLKLKGYGRLKDVENKVQRTKDILDLHYGHHAVEIINTF